MIATLPDGLESFVQSEVATGHYANREEVIAAGYQMQLRQAEGVDAANLQMVLAEADEEFAAGSVRQFEDEAELRAFAEEVKSRGRVSLTSGPALNDHPESVPETDEIGHREFDEALSKTNRKYGRALKKLAE